MMSIGRRAEVFGHGTAQVSTSASGKLDAIPAGGHSSHGGIIAGIARVGHRSQQPRSRQTLHAAVRQECIAHLGMGVTHETEVIPVFLHVGSIVAKYLKRRLIIGGGRLEWMRGVASSKPVVTGHNRLRMAWVRINSREVAGLMVVHERARAPDGRGGLGGDDR